MYFFFFFFFLLSLIVEEIETTQINQNYESINNITKTTHNIEEKLKIS